MDTFSLIANLISYFFISCFLFCYNKLRYSKTISFGVLAGLVMALSGVELQRFVLEDGDISSVSLVAVVLQAVLILIVSYYISEYKDGRPIFSGLVASNYVMLGNTVIQIVAFGSQNKTMGIVAGVIVDIAVFVIINWLLRESYMLVLDKVYLHWYAWCFIPIMFYFISYTTTTYPSSIFETPTNMVPAILTSVVMVVFYGIFFKYLKTVYERQEIQTKMTLMDAYANGVKIQAESVRKSENEVRILRHDLKHLLNLISIMLEQKEYDRAKEILKQYVPPNAREEYRTFCGNTVVNGILNTIQLRGKKAGVDVRIRAQLPEAIAAAEMDVALVLSNMTENAIRTVRKIDNMDNRWVEVSIRLLDNKIIIEMKNPFMGKVEFDSETGFPKSNRGKDHGFGMQSVGAVAWKYHGLTDFFTENQIFISRVILTNSEVENVGE